ncbi:hypothetical protein D3C80_1479880 [compost metagenome]
MKLNEIIDAVHASKLEAEICAIIEFELPSSGQSIDPPGDYVIESPTDHEFLAFDGSGGEFYLLQDGRVLFLGQGSAGVVARDFLRMMTLKVLAASGVAMPRNGGCRKPWMSHGFTGAMSSRPVRLPKRESRLQSISVYYLCRTRSERCLQPSRR